VTEAFEAQFPWAPLAASVLFLVLTVWTIVTRRRK
jgi:hypothetical protein